MPSSDHGKHHVFNRSFDTASQNTPESHETGPNARGRRTVPYVNERREFDPRYDPRKPETFYLFHRPGREGFDDEDRVSPDSELPTNTEVPQDTAYRAMSGHASAFEAQKQQFYNASTSRHLIHASPRTSSYTRVTDHFEQRRQLPVTASSHEVGSTGKVRRTFFHPEDDLRMDRPFDESSSSFRESTAEVDSLDEVMDQDSFTTTTDTTGEGGRFENVLSAIEEHPSLEAGSLSYSFTQLTGPAWPSVKSADSSCDKNTISNSSSRSHSPLDATSYPQSGGNIYRSQGVGSAKSSPKASVTPDPIQQNQQSRQSLLITPDSSRRLQQGSRSPRRINTWDMSTPSPVNFGASSPSTAMTTPETPSVASSSLSPSEKARKETEKMLQTFNTCRSKQEPKTTSAAYQIPANTSASTTEETDTLNTMKSEDQDLTLHDLCGESSSTDDVAWRNALHVLSIQPHLASVLDGAAWTPLHVACLGSTPPPIFMTRSLLYVYREAARKVDSGGRLPLHLVAASSGDAETMQLLIQEYPQSVYQTDCQGWTPLHLILKNFRVDVHLTHCRVLLGLVSSEETEVLPPRVLQRRGEHLSLPVEHLDRIVSKSSPVTRLAQEDMHESTFRDFPRDVQTSLRRLCQWKRKQRRQNPQNGVDDAVELQMALSPDSETNPAAHFTPVNRQLPIHIVVRRGLSESRSQFNSDDIEEESDECDSEEPTSTGLSPRFFDLVRLFIAFYPEGLIARNHNGHTPLLAALAMNNAQPSLELVELLLGKRTSGYNTLPLWAQNMPLYNFNSDRYLNPAMIPCKKSHQLPLHVVAEEMADNFSMLSSIQRCYPGAIQCQDSRGRTPLHILLRNYRRSQVDPRSVALLLSDNVAQTVDDEGKLPFDLLAEKARNIPLEEPHFKNPEGVSADDVLSFKKFFQGTIIASSEPSVRNRLKSDDFLWRLRSLPPWLRRQACSATFVQDLLIEELASPLKCALILLHASLQCALIVGFRFQVQDYIDSPEAPIPTWIALLVYTSASGLLFFQLVFWSLCMSMSEVLHLCVLNLWRWIDFSAILLVCAATTMMNYPALSHDTILATSTVATGMVWLSAVGFFASWFYGASLFSACVQKIASLMIWPGVVASILIACFAQMFYTIAQTNCDESLGEMGLCSHKKSYTLVYFLLVGEPIVDGDSDARTARSIVALSVLLVAAFLLLALGVLTLTLTLAGSTCDFEEVALTSFWEPKLTYVIFACSKGSAFSKSKTSSSLETAWAVATDILSGRDGAKGTYWYACFTRKPAIVKAGYWLLAVFFVPIWLLVGLFTFGLLWPPQVRRFLFRPHVGDQLRPSQGTISPTELYASQVSSLRNELTQIRDMSYERSNDVQRDLRQLKEILHLATAE